MNLTLKKEGRESLRKPLGKLIKANEELLGELKDRELITVGDKATQTVLELELKPKLAIVDYKIGRKEIDYNYQGKFKRVLSAINKPGQISEEATKKIKESLKYENCLLEIDGEEDLLVLPVILKLKTGIVCYGQPNEGIVLIKIEKKKKRESKEFIGEMFYSLIF
jgi:hypothetical protein